MTRAGSSWLLWPALAAALSPSLVDLARHVATNPWSRGAAIFPLLFAWCAWSAKERQAPARDGWGWLALGVALSLLGVGGGMPRVGRPGVALAFVGLARATGAPPLRCALLAAFAIPLPTQLFARLAPGLEGAVAWAAAGVATHAGVVAHVDWSPALEIRLVGAGGHELSLYPADGGLALAWTLAGLGWFAAVRCGAPLRGAASRALRWAVAAAPLQALVLASACAASLLGAPGAARAGLDAVVPAAAAAGLALAARRPRPVSESPAPLAAAGSRP